MKYYTYIERADCYPARRIFYTYSEREIIDMYWHIWYNKMSKKYGEEYVVNNYTKKDCIQDWVTVNSACESLDGGKHNE